MQPLASPNEVLAGGGDPARGGDPAAGDPAAGDPGPDEDRDPGEDPDSAGGRAEGL
jgi:hypothetical protein